MKPWEQFTNQQQWKEYLQNLVRTNKRALYRSIILIADLQTPEEKVWGATIKKNNMGFGAVDAEMMTSLALRLKCGGELTERELAICRNKMPKYWRQLMIISKRRMEDEQKKVQEEFTGGDIGLGHGGKSHSLNPGLHRAEGSGKQIKLEDGQSHGQGRDHGEAAGQSHSKGKYPGETAG